MSQEDHESPRPSTLPATSSFGVTISSLGIVIAMALTAVTLAIVAATYQLRRIADVLLRILESVS